MLTRRYLMKFSIATAAALLPVASARASSLQDVLEDLESDLLAAKSIVAGQSGPLPQAPRDAVEALLISALSGIASASTSWELIDITGEIEASYGDDTLSDVAANCAKLARYARGEDYNGRTGWEQRCANHLATLKDLINRSATGYKARAGIV